MKARHHRMFELLKSQVTYGSLFCYLPVPAGSGRPTGTEVPELALFDYRYHMKVSVLNFVSSFGIAVYSDTSFNPTD